MNKYYIRYVNNGNAMTEYEKSLETIEGDKIELNDNGDIQIIKKGEIIFFGNSKNVSVEKLNV